MPGATTSWTEISTYRHCPHKWDLQYNGRWKAPKNNAPLDIGILWHEILDLHYRGIRDGDGPNTAGIIELLNQHGAKDEEEKVGPICLWMYHAYRDWCRKEDAKWAEIIEVETAFEVPLLDTGIMLTGRIDLVVRAWRHLWVVDHKAVKTIPNDRELDLDDQTPLYIWAMRQAGYDVRGAILSFSRYQRLKRDMTHDERFRRESIYRADDELESVVRDAADTVVAAREDPRRERHPDTMMCKWRCPYVEACIGGRRAPHLEAGILRSQGFRQTTGEYTPLQEEPKLRIVDPGT